MKNLLKLLLVSVCMALLVPAAASAEVTFREASVVEFEGTVKVIIAGGQKEYTPYKGMGLTQGDTIITSGDSWVTIHLDDDKEIKLAENSRLILSELSEYVDSQSESTGLNLFAGKIWVSIKKKLNIRSKFEVRTGSTIMGVKGTKFLIKVNYTNADEEERQLQDQNIAILSMNPEQSLRRRTELYVLDGTVATSFERMEQGPDGHWQSEEGSFDVHAKQRAIMDEGRTGDYQLNPLTSEQLDLFLLEAMKDDPEGIDEELLKNIDDLIEEKRQQEKAQKEQQKDQKEKNDDETGSGEESLTYYGDIQAPSAPQLPANMEWEPQPQPQLIQISPIGNTSLYFGETKDLPLNIQPQDVECSVISSDTSIAEAVVSNGQLHMMGKNPGTATVTISANKAGYETAALSFVVSVLEQPTISIIRILEQVVDVGEVISAEVECNPSDVVLSVAASNPGVAQVSVSGSAIRVTGKAAGETKVTVTASKNLYSSISTDFIVTVKEKEVSDPTKGNETVTITAPSDQSVFNARYGTTISGTATNQNQDLSLIKVSVKDNGSKLYYNPVNMSYDSEEPCYLTTTEFGEGWTISLQPSVLSNSKTGNLTITALAYDGKDGIPASITVKVDNAPPKLLGGQIPVSLQPSGQENSFFVLEFSENLSQNSVEHLKNVILETVCEYIEGCLSFEWNNNVELGTYQLKVSNTLQNQFIYFNYQNQVNVPISDQVENYTTIELISPLMNIEISEMNSIVVNIEEEWSDYITVEPGDVELSVSDYNTELVEISINEGRLTIYGVSQGSTSVTLTAQKQGYNTASIQLYVTIAGT